MQKSKKLLTLALSSLLLAGCGGTGTDKPETAHEHSFRESWAYDANGHFHVCNNCKERTESQSHELGEWEVTKKATASVEGEKKRTCKVCGYEDYREIDAHSHQYNGYGYDETNHWKVCTVEDCGQKDDTSVEAHKFGNSNNNQNSWGNGNWGMGGGNTTNSADDGWETVLEPTGTTEGRAERTCVCGYKETKVLPVVHEHTFDTTKWEKDANGHWHPATCGHTDVKGSDAGHTYGAWTTKKEATATEAGSKERTCSVCSYVDTQTIPATGVVSDSFTFGSDITTAQKIHTTDQENFLKFSGDYYNITSAQLNGYNAKGDSERSFPNQVSVSWDYTVPAGKTIKNYSIITGQNEDLSDGYEITGSTAKSVSFYNAFLGTNYFKVIANFTDNTKESSPIKTFLVDGTAPRNLKVGTMSNCRDMGGRTTIAGGKIKQGLIYRTSDPATSGVGDVSEWTKRMGIKSEIYVKDGNNSSGPLGSSVKFYNASMDYGATPYSNMSRNAERLRYVFSILGDARNYPAMYHCRIGTDRTGICGVAINGLLGVPFNEVIQDYAFSNFGKIDGQRYAHKTPDNNGDDIAKYIDEILAMPGDNFQQQVAYSLLSIGVPAQTLQNVIDILTEGNKVTIPTNVTIANGSALSVTGGSKKTATDYKNPDTYYEISGSSQSVSYTYNLAEAKDVSVIAYLGCTDSSDSKKLASGIDLKIDGASKTICDKTYFKAGFGQTQQARRTGYMFNILGTYNLSAGNHTITISGKNSDKFYIGSIEIVGGGSNISVTPGSNTEVNTGGESGENNNQPVVDNSIKLAVSESTGYNDPTAKMKSDAIWAVDNTKIPAGTYKVSVELRLGESSGHGDKTLMEGADKPYYTLKINSTAYGPTDTTSTRASLGINYNSFTNVEYVSSLTVPTGLTEVRFVYTGTGYSMKVNSITFTPIA